MEYKGYTARVEFDDEAAIFHGEILNLRDVITFEGTTVEELRQAFKDSIDDYLEFCAGRDEEPERPFSGKFVVRIDPELHREVYLRAKMENKSLNSWISQRIESAVSTKR
jgi:predicted HicB family RNase H-like nuclease